MWPKQHPPQRSSQIALPTRILSRYVQSANRESLSAGPHIQHALSPGYFSRAHRLLDPGPPPSPANTLAYDPWWARRLESQWRTWHSLQTLDGIGGYSSCWALNHTNPREFPFAQPKSSRLPLPSLAHPLLATCSCFAAVSDYYLREIVPISSARSITLPFYHPRPFPQRIPTAQSYSLLCPSQLIASPIISADHACAQARERATDLHPRPALN